MTQPKLALILGANGGVASETALALSRHGWRLRALVRRMPETPHLDAEWVIGDAMNADDVMRAAEGASIIFHGVHPPGYRNWRKLSFPMLQNTIAAAEAVGARILFPGTVYNYGRDAFPTLREDAPQHPISRKGAVRVEMEAQLEAASARGVRVLIVRCGDFFGPRCNSSWLSQGMVKLGAPVRSITYPGKAHVGHAWAYLPDVGETFARLVDREADLARFERFHFGGHPFARGVAFAEAVRDVAGNPRASIRALPWGVIVALSPAVPLFRELAEMRYLWLRDSVFLDNSKLVAFLGAEPHTPLADALHRSLAAIGCLEPQIPAASAIKLGLA